MPWPIPGAELLPRRKRGVGATVQERVAHRNGGMPYPAGAGGRCVEYTTICFNASVRQVLERFGGTEEEGSSQKTESDADPRRTASFGRLGLQYQQPKQK